MLLLQELRDGLRERLRLPVGHLGVERDVHLEPLRARGLGEGLETDALEELAHPEPDLAAVHDRCGRSGIEVEHHHRRPIDRGGERERGVQLEVGEVGGPDERGNVVGQAEVDVALVVAAPDRRGLHPLRAVRGALLLVEELALDAVGVALHGQRPAVQVRDQDRRHARVVVDHLALGEAGLRIEDLVEVR